MKLSPLVIVMAGAVLGAVAISFALFSNYIPVKGSADNLDRYNDGLDQQIAKKRTVEANKEEALRLRAEVESQWNEIVLAHTPPASVSAGGIDLSVNAWQLTVDARSFRDSVQSAVNRQLKRGGVTVLQGALVPDPPTTAETVLADYFGYPGMNFPACVFNMGTVTVQGTYAQISQNVRAWSRMPGYMAVVDGLTLSGTSPRLTASYSVTVVAIPRARVVAPAVPGGGGVASTPGGGGFGGPPAGFGGPPAGLGGPPAGLGGPAGAFAPPRGRV